VAPGSIQLEPAPSQQQRQHRAKSDSVPSDFVIMTHDRIEAQALTADYSHDDNGKICAAELDANNRNKRHGVVAALSFAVFVAFDATVVLLNRLHHIEPPSSGNIDVSAPIGWVAVCGAIVVMGSYGIMVKVPSVQKVDCDCMVFNVYMSAGKAMMCLPLFLAGSSETPVFCVATVALGALFATLWIVLNVLFFVSINTLGYAVASALSNSTAILTAFTWGVVVFGDSVADVASAACSLTLMIIGIFLSVFSFRLSDAQAPKTATSKESPADGESAGGLDAASMFLGVATGVGTGIACGSQMVPLTLFKQGAPLLGLPAYEGRDPASLAFLPSLAVGVLVMQPVLFLLYWGPSMLRGMKPRFHVADVALPGLGCGAISGMGYFCSMFTSVYLGQALGYSLTQVNLVVASLWGVVYYKEIQGRAAIAAFSLSSLVIVVGAVLYSLSW